MSQKVRAKFICESVKEYEGGYKEAELRASTDEKNSFSDATPYGQLKIGISTGVQANNYFKPGQAYYLDFSEVPAE